MAPRHRVPRPGLLLAALGPGLLVAATGVGAGDLLTAGLAGSAVGVSLAWAAWVGSILKGVLTEGVARWQLATGLTLIEGWILRLGRPIRWIFLAYFLLWSLVTGGALVNACGVAGTGILPLAEDPRTSKIAWGAIHSFAGIGLVLAGGYRLFERLMTACIALMVVCVVATALLVAPDAGTLARGLLLPAIPRGGAGWTLGVLGGVGGTVTLLSYGYWIREEGREGAAGLRACRLDLFAGYAVTAVFGVSMIVIGSGLSLERGPLVALDLASRLGDALGPVGRGLFLAGFWGAVFSSLLGVWQSAPYLFADLLSVGRAGPRGEDGIVEESDGIAAGDRDDAGTGGAALTSSAAYRAYLVALGVVPLPLLLVPVRSMQLVYAIFGALFMPLLAASLLVLNNRAREVGAPFRNGWLVNAVLVLTLALFAWIGAREVAVRAAELLG